MKILTAPIHMDAMVLSHATTVKDAVADFTRLPYSDTNRDYNTSTPYIGEAILNHPFQDKNLILGPGTHIHWALPMGFTKAIDFRMLRKTELDSLKRFFDQDSNWKSLSEWIWTSILTASGLIKKIGKKRASVLTMDNVDKQKFDAGIRELVLNANLKTPNKFVKALMALLHRPLGNNFPCVPNVWLVNRKKNNKLEASWIVESNYIANQRTKDQGNFHAINIPFYDDRPDNKTQPYRFMGRQFHGTNMWTSGKLKGEKYLEEITAVGYNPQAGTKGYAEPTFAAFYPNSMSVFGCYDREITAVDPSITYEVLGVYSNADNDYLKIFLNDFNNRHSKKDQAYYSLLNKALLSEFRWEIADESPLGLKDAQPDQVVFFGKTRPKVSKKPKKENLKIAIGNSGTEALSAFLATNISNTGDKHTKEEVFEAIQLSSRLNNKVLDVGHKFQEARHDKGFTAKYGGIIWSILIESIENPKVKDDHKRLAHDWQLPENIAVSLNEVNLLQANYLRAIKDIIACRKQLYADWYKYMINAYPPTDAIDDVIDVDQIITCIRNERIPELNEKINAIGTIGFARDKKGRLKSVQASGKKTNLANQLATSLKKLIKDVNDFTKNKPETGDKKSLKDKGKCLAIRSKAAARFWEPNDPVILFAEKPTARQQTGLINSRHTLAAVNETKKCLIFDFEAIQKNKAFNFTQAQVLLQDISKLFKDIPVTDNDVEDYIWNPFMMEYEVEFIAASLGNNDSSNSRNYKSDYVTKNFQLKETDPDFSLHGQSDNFADASIYRGATILTPHANISLTSALKKFIENHGEDQSAATKKLLKDAQNYLEKSNVLSQSLGGFNEAMLMQKLTRQLDVADPLGFPSYQDFTTNEVAPLVGEHNITAPQPLNQFNPIRSGTLKILKLRLIDTFGKTVEFVQPPFITSETLAYQEENTALLKPRLAQPARLNFRLLSASAGQTEMNTHPASSPICGWLLPNNLDRSIMFYDQDGFALGAMTLNASNPWQPAPDASYSMRIGDISNRYLRRVANYLLNQQLESIAKNGSSENSFLQHFIKALDSAQENIDPENFAEHQDIALLMGKPVAVVRAKLDIELEGPAAKDQSWSHLFNQLNGWPESDGQFTDVKFPIRLGEHQQFNDGLFGYWLENEEGELSEKYYSSEASSNLDPHIISYAEGGAPVNIYKSIAEAPTCVTMLFDPKGIVHAVSGILPVKSISIPKNQYQNALKNIAITFRVGPILSAPSHLKISLPNEAGLSWTWIEKNKAKEWQEIPQTIIIQKSLFDSKFPDRPDLWYLLVNNQWLQPLEDDAERATITSHVHRAFPPNESGGDAAFPVDIGKRLDNFFDVYGKRIQPFDMQAVLDEAPVLREGWLQLSQQIQNKSNS